MAASAASAASALRRAALPAALENGPHRWVMDLGTEIWQVGFAKTLGLNNSLEVQNYSHEEGLTAKYTVPETVCVGDATRKYLPCGVTAAVFDEFSTLAMMLKDKPLLCCAATVFEETATLFILQYQQLLPLNVLQIIQRLQMACTNASAQRRPVQLRLLRLLYVLVLNLILCVYPILLLNRTHRAGVSVTLSAEMFRKVEPGQKLRINSRATKIGKIMGYADMTAETECGTLVARGRHVKFLPMGRAWDLLMLPPLLPVAAAFHKRDIAKRLQDPERTMVRGTSLGLFLLLHCIYAALHGSFRAAQLSERSCYCCVQVQQQYASRALLVLALCMQPNIASFKSFDALSLSVISDLAPAANAQPTRCTCHTNFTLLLICTQQGIPAGQTLTDQLVLHQLLLHEEAEEASTIRSSSTTNTANSGTSDSSSSSGDSAREASPPTRILRGSAVLDIPVRLHNYVGTFHGGAISSSNGGLSAVDSQYSSGYAAIEASTTEERYYI
eukprot:9113-Heterococcus_DN1.PRE.2